MLKYLIYLIKVKIRDYFKIIKPMTRLFTYVFFGGNMVVILIHKWNIIYCLMWFIISWIIALILVLIFVNEDIDTKYIRNE